MNYQIGFRFLSFKNYRLFYSKNGPKNTSGRLKILTLGFEFKSKIEFEIFWRIFDEYKFGYFTLFIQDHSRTPQYSNQRRSLIDLIIAQMKRK